MKDSGQKRENEPPGGYFCLATLSLCPSNLLSSALDTPAFILRCDELRGRVMTCLSKKRSNGSNRPIDIHSTIDEYKKTGCNRQAQNVDKS